MSRAQLWEQQVPATTYASESKKPPYWPTECSVQWTSICRWSERAGVVPDESGFLWRLPTRFVFSQSERELCWQTRMVSVCICMCACVRAYVFLSLCLCVCWQFKMACTSLKTAHFRSKWRRRDCWQRQPHVCVPLARPLTPSLSLSVCPFRSVIRYVPGAFLAASLSVCLRVLVNFFTALIVPLGSFASQKFCASAAPKCVINVCNKIFTFLL